MHQTKQNYYGSLCTEVYEILHEKAPQDELDFYLSYAKKGEKILEALCGSGRFLIPFMQRGFHIVGIDWSAEMLSKLKQKAPDAQVVQADLTAYSTQEQYDYIFIASGSVSLFTDIELCIKILEKLKGMLTPNGKLVFAVETAADKCPDDDVYKTVALVKTAEGNTLLYKSKNYYDAQSQTQFSPGLYALYNRENTLLQSETMDFQTHLYTFGEMEGYLQKIGFGNVKTYASFSKDLAVDDRCEMFLFECSIA